MSLTATVAQVLRTRVNAGLRDQIRRLCPVKTGALRRSVRLRILERHGHVVLRCEMLDYFRFQRAQGVRQHLVPAIGRLLTEALKESAIDGTRIHLLRLVGEWSKELQQATSQNIPGSLTFQFRFFLVNDGRT